MPGSGVGTPGQERILPGILKDLGYLPDPSACWLCPSDTRALSEVRLSAGGERIESNNTSYCGNFKHYNAGWPSPPFSMPPGPTHQLEIHHHTEIYSPGEVIYAFNGVVWTCTNPSNATDSSVIEGIRWSSPSVALYINGVYRHAPDLPNILFCDSHVVPFSLLDIRDPENWAIEGGLQP